MKLLLLLILIFVYFSFSKEAITLETTSETVKSALKSTLEDNKQFRKFNCSPIFGTCHYYKECLEKEIPCGHQGYALGYGNYFCNRYYHYGHLLSPAGKYLQMKLKKFFDKLILKVKFGEIMLGIVCN